MSPEDLVVEVRDSTLERIGSIPLKDLELVATARAQGVGTYEITVPTGSFYAAQLREPGAGVIITLRGKEYLSGPVVTPEIKYALDDIAGSITFTGVSDSIHLSDRLAYPQPSNGDVTTQNVASWDYTGPAESAMHALVAQNIGQNAHVSRIIPGLVTGHNNLQGSVATYSARWSQLAYYLNTWGAANDIGYHIIQRGNQLVFETWVLNDMTREVRLSVEGGGLSSAKISYSPPGLTHAIVGGKGSGAARVIREYTTTKSTQGALTWDRRIERFIDQSGAQDVAALQTAGLKELNAKGFTVVTSEAIPNEVEHMEFGRDWNVGDYITLEFEGRELDTTVASAILKADSTGVRLGVTLGDATGFNPTAKVAGKLEEQTRNYERTSVENEIPTQDIEQVQADMLVAQEDIGVAQTTLVTHASTLSTHTFAIETAQDDIAAAQVDIAAAEADIVALQAEVVALQTDGDAPSTAPTVATIGALGQIFVKWAGVTNNDPVKYEVHVSDTASFTPSGATLLTTTTATMISAKTEADNTPFTYGTTYYFQVRAVDDDGAGPYSAEVSDQMDQTGIADLAVGSVTAEKLESLLVLATKIATASGTGVRVEIDEDGIRSYDSGNNLLINWSAATGLLTWQSAANGERAVADADGFSTYTNNPVLKSSILGPPGLDCTAIALNDAGDTCFSVWRDPLGDTVVLRSNSLNGLATYFSVEMTTDAVTSSGSYVYASDIGVIKKLNSSGVEVTGSGYPISVPAGVGSLTNDGTHLYGVDYSGDLRKWLISTGAEVTTGGWPVAGSFTEVTTSSTDDLYASTTSDIQRRSKSTGAEVVGSGFPIALTTTKTIGVDGTGNLFACKLNTTYKYSTATGAAVTGSGFPRTVSESDLAANGTVLVLARDNTSSKGIEVRNNTEGFQSVRIDSSDGSIEGYPGVFTEVETHNLTASGWVELARLIAPADDLQVTATRFSRTAAQNITSGATGANVSFDTDTGSGTSGTTDYWSRSGATITVNVAGVYDITAMPVVAADVNGGRRVQLIIDGVVILDRFEQSFSGSVSWRFPLALSKYPLDAGDTIQLKIIQTSGSSLSCAGSFLSIARAGTLAS